jgi:uncharacterized protein YjeT (DUF2065 family)
MTLRGQFKKKRQGDDMVAKSPTLEARARIIWGESSLSVHDFLTSNGISAAEADSKIMEYQHERNAEIRKIGVRSILIGLLVLVLSTFTLYVFAWPLDRGSIALANRGIAVIGVVWLYGVWKLVIGLVYLIYPKSVRKSVSDVGEWDVFSETFDK